MWKRLTAMWIAFKGDALRLWFALGHPDAPFWLKAGTGALVLYLISPIDLIPDVLPVIGVVDDLILVPAGGELVVAPAAAPHPPVRPRTQPGWYGTRKSVDPSRR